MSVDRLCSTVNIPPIFPPAKGLNFGESKMSGGNIYKKETFNIVSYIQARHII